MPRALARTTHRANPSSPRQATPGREPNDHESPPSHLAVKLRLSPDFLLVLPRADIDRLLHSINDWLQLLQCASPLPMIVPSYFAGEACAQVATRRARPLLLLLSALLALACSGSPRAPALHAASTQRGQPRAAPTAQQPSAPPVVSAAPPASERPCALQQRHEQELRRAAGLRAREHWRALRTPDFDAQSRPLRQLLAQLGADVQTLSSGSKRIDALSPSELELLSRVEPSGDAAGYAHAKAELATLDQTRDALEQGNPPPTDPSALDPDFCREDPLGAWASWTIDSSYAPEVGSDTAWVVAKKLGIARITNDGQVNVSEQFPSFLDPVPADPKYVSADRSNCCWPNYNQGEPRVVFTQDQTGDGIPELALAASFAVEGTSEHAAMVYQVDRDELRVQQLDFDHTDDVDHDDRLDLVFLDRLEVGDQCGSGFPAGVTGNSYIGHALSDGSYSFDDPVAVAFTRTQCPARPSVFGSYQEIWCGKVWNVPSSAIRRGIQKQCASDPCQGSRKKPCAWLLNAEKGFQPRLHLEQATTSHPR